MPTKSCSITLPIISTPQTKNKTKSELEMHKPKAITSNQAKPHCSRGEKEEP